MSTIGLKLTISCPKQCSVIKKVKPHRARILFWKQLKSCPKWFAQSKFFFHHQLWLKWSLHTKNDYNWTKIDDFDACCFSKLTIFQLEIKQIGQTSVYFQKVKYHSNKMGYNRFSNSSLSRSY